MDNAGFYIRWSVCCHSAAYTRPVEYAGHLRDGDPARQSDAPCQPSSRGLSFEFGCILKEALLNPRIIASPGIQGWAAMAADVIGQAINSTIACRGVCHVMLTGGNTVAPLYRHWAGSSALPWDRIRFLFGDERCVPPDHDQSNYALTMRTLLSNGLPAGCSIMRMNGDNPDRDAAAQEYELLLPAEIDVLLLGVGTDGHIASLFPGSHALHPAHRTVLPVTAPVPPHERLTITPRVIGNSKSIFLLATGEEKGRILAEALISPGDYTSLPVRLALGGTWLLDEAAARIVSGNSD